jgi:hypothetical protein
VSIKLSRNFSCIIFPSYKKILREIKKVMKISLVHTNGKKERSYAHSFTVTYTFLLLSHVISVLMVLQNFENHCCF